MKHPDIGEILRSIPGLPRPLVLLEGGSGGSGVVRLAWGAKNRHRLDWNPDRAGDMVWLDDLPGDVELYGFVSYDLGIPPHARRREPLASQPLAEFFEPEHTIVLAGREDSDRLTAPGASALREAVKRSAGMNQANEPAAECELVARSFSQSEFMAAVETVQGFIAAGDVYQANISVASAYRPGAGPWKTYRRIREINPSPWMGFADFGDWQVVSGSPELLVEVDEAGGRRRVRTRPIAGTRKKTGDATRNAAMRAELTLDEKEQAEHLMLVDLARNDIGRVVEYGSLEVPETGVVEEYSHVYHLVSEVQGVLRRSASHAEVLRALFPCGTITGVPKIRAMEVISEIEPVARGGYTGGMGWMGPDGMQFNILIRSAMFTEKTAVIQAGAGIVWDSIPEREWFESLRKAEAMRIALEGAR